jgi:hypothetical protein
VTVRRVLRVTLVGLLVPVAAEAADARDATHGRVDGDMAVSLGVGATLGARAPRATAELRLRYLSTAGAFVSYEDGPLVASGAEPRRALATGFELRPLFIGRWMSGLESGHPYLDLTLDSLALELGAVFAQPEGVAFGSRPGLQAGLGLEVPLFPRATGLFVGLHGGARWSDRVLAGGPVAGPGDRALYLTLVLSWQQVFGAHVVDRRDRAP